MTPAQQAEADRNRILTKLETGKADPGVGARSRNRMLAWGSAGAALVVLIGGGILWLSGDKVGSDLLPPASVAVAPIVVAPVAPAVIAPAADVLPSAATIHDEPATAGAAASAGALHDMLNAPAGGKHDNDPLGAALADGTIGGMPKVAQAAPAASKSAPKGKPGNDARKAPASAEPDSDVALLSALVAHNQANRAREEAASPLPTVKEELNACNVFKGGKAKQCRLDACNGNWKTNAECKTLEKTLRPAGEE